MPKKMDKELSEKYPSLKKVAELGDDYQDVRVLLQPMTRFV